MKNQIYWVVGIVIIAGVALGVVNNQSSEATETIQSTDTLTQIEQTTTLATSNEDGTIVSYDGQTGRSALDLLKESTDATTEESSFGEYVTAINEVGGSTSQYWLFYVDGEPATVGAADYVTTDGETIEWRYE